MSWRAAKRFCIAACALLLLAALSGFVGETIDTPPLYHGPVSDHFDGHRFFNPEGENGTGGAQRNGVLHFLRIAVEGSEHPHWPATVPVRQTMPPRRVAGSAMHVTWIGHATTLVQTEGLNILFDPVWADRASPVSFAGPRRVRAPGVKLQDLPPIDLILISHDHYDHLDLTTLRYLVGRDHPRIVTGLGNDRLLALDGIPATAGDWGQTIAIRPGLSVRIMRAHHWSERWLGERDETLWAGFRIGLPGGDIYYSGDTGPGDMAWAREAAAGPPIRLALLPIAPYKLTTAPSGNHIDPGQAAGAFALIDPAYALGVHWGTFQLGEETVDDAPRRLRAALLARGIDPQRFRTMEPGASWDVPTLVQATSATTAMPAQRTG